MTVVDAMPTSYGEWCYLRFMKRRCFFDAYTPVSHIDRHF